MSPLLRLLVMFIVLISGRASGQEPGGIYNKTVGLPGHLFDAIDRKAASLETRMAKQTDKYLQRLAAKEKRLRRRLMATDSIAAKQLSDDGAPYMQAAAGSPASTTVGKVAYQPYVDSLKTALSYLQQHKELLSGTKDAQRLDASLAQLNSLESKLRQSEQVSALVEQRRQLMHNLLSRYTSLPGNIGGLYNDYKIEAYYYSRQADEIRAELNSPEKLLQRALSVLNTLPGFRQFMVQYSQLAGMFSIPAGYGSASVPAGLQSRSEVESLLQNQLPAGGPNMRQYLQAAEAQLNQLKDRLPGAPFAGNNAASDNLPNFTPNNQRTRPFLKRLELGTNLQTVSSNYFFPTTSDLGLSVGYMLNDKNTIGVGASAKMGWGKDIRHIAVTTEGLGLRSFVDIKLKGSFYASGGYEYNYQPTGILAPGGEAGAVPAWQPSGLVGISKIISLKSKLFKKTKLQLFWDFLSYRQTPEGQPLKFRVGYVF